MLMVLDNNIRGGISSVMGDRYVKSDENKKIWHYDANNVHGWAMDGSLPYDEFEFVKNVKLENLLKTEEDYDIGYSIEIDLQFPDEIKEKRKYFQFCPESKTKPQDKLSDYMSEMKPRNYTQNKELICDCTDKKFFNVIKARWFFVLDTEW